MFLLFSCRLQGLPHSHIWFHQHQRLKMYSTRVSKSVDGAGHHWRRKQQRTESRPSISTFWTWCSLGLTHPRWVVSTVGQPTGKRRAPITWDYCHHCYTRTYAKLNASTKSLTLKELLLSGPTVYQSNALPVYATDPATCNGCRTETVTFRRAHDTHKMLW